MLGELVALLVVTCIAVLMWMAFRNVLLLVVNSVIGFFALFGYNYLFGTEVVINFWSVAIVTVGGIFGFIIVVGSHYLGWMF